MGQRIALLLSSVACVCSFAFAQSFTLNTSYQLGKHGESYGIAGSRWLATWNDEKVVLRGTLGLFAGNQWGDLSAIHDYRRIELGIESRNTMVTGKDVFNILALSHSFATYNQSTNAGMVQRKDNGWLFSVGLGTKLMKPTVVMARYVWGVERGIRIGMEFDF